MSAGGALVAGEIIDSISKANNKAAASAIGGFIPGRAFLDTCMATSMPITINDIARWPSRRTKNIIMSTAALLRNDLCGGSTNIGMSLSNWAVLIAITCALSSHTRK